MLHTNVVSRVDNGMTCHLIGYDRYDIQMHRNPATALVRFAARYATYEVQYTGGSI